MAPDWVNVGWATVVNALFAKADTCRLPVFGNTLDVLDSGVCRNDQSAIHQRFSNEGSFFPLLHAFHFSIAEIFSFFFPACARWLRNMGLPCIDRADGIPLVFPISARRVCSRYRSPFFFKPGVSR